jgi:hypothetical protein
MSTSRRRPSIRFPPPEREIPRHWGCTRLWAAAHGFGPAPSGKFSPQGFRDQRRDHPGNIAVERGQLFYRRGTEHKILGIGGHEYGFYGGSHGFVHHGKLKFIGKIPHIPHSPEQEPDVLFPDKIDNEGIAPGNGYVFPWFNQGIDHGNPFFHGEKIGFLPVFSHNHQNLIKNASRPFDYVKVS